MHRLPFSQNFLFVYLAKINLCIKTDPFLVAVGIFFLIYLPFTHQGKTQPKRL